MKRIAFVVLTIVCTNLASMAQYFETNRRTIPTPPDEVISNPCTPTVVERSLAFGFEPLREDNASLDIVVGKMVWTNPSFGDPLYYPFTFAYNEGGNFPNYTLFALWSSLCHAPSQIKRLIFGNLRPWLTPPRKDLALIQSGFDHRMRIFHNHLTAPDPLGQVQHVHIGSSAVDGAWGAFDRRDDYEDLAVTDPDNLNGPEIRIYRNLQNGLLDDVNYNSFRLGNEYRAQQIILAQINGMYEDPVSNNKLDLIGIDGTKIKIWRNNNLDELPLEPPYKQQIDLQIGTITSLAVADINNDGWNDVLVGTMHGARLFFNTANSNGDIQEQASWLISNPVRKHLIAFGDIGSPGPGGETRADGWKDLVVATSNNDDRVVLRVFINHRGAEGVWFTTTPQQELINPIGPEEDPGEEQGAPCNQDEPLAIQLQDVKTNGGLSVVYHVLCNDNKLFLFHNNGNPAPAPPKGVTIEATPPNQYGYSYPRIKWAKNSEADLSGYQLWRMTTGANCGTSNWSVIADNLPATQTEYTDLSIGTVMPGGDCTASYTLKAKDNANNYSDTSKNVQINYASYMWKISEMRNSKPTAYGLHAAHPNPFNPSTTIKYDLPEDSYVSFVLYDVLGRQVAEIVNSKSAAGYHSTTWNAAGAASGVYIARFTASDLNGGVQFTKIAKLILVK